MNQIKELEPIYQRKLPILVKEKININKTHVPNKINKINDDKFILDYVNISLAGNCRSII